MTKKNQPISHFIMRIQKKVLPEGGKRWLMFCLLFILPFWGLSQNRLITLNSTNKPIKEVLQSIEKQTGFYFQYSSELINADSKVDVQVKGATLQETLDKLFSSKNIRYAIDGKQILLSSADKQNEKRQAVKGRVVDSKGLPLPGVTVTVKGKTNGTTTGVTGDFVLSNVGEQDVLLFSFVGMKKKEMPVMGRKFLEVSLEDDNLRIGEVVVTAMGIEKQSKSLTYNVQKLDSKQITAVKDANFMNSLVGKVAGVTINNSSSGVGGASRVVMRGTKSIAGNNNALYVVDGVPLLPLQTAQPSDLFTGMGQSGDGISQLNAEDIESISVLNGPAAAALYGSEAANGVVMITTKKGKDENISLEVNNTTNFFSPFVMPQFQNTYGSEPGSYYSWGEKMAKPSTYNPKDFFQTGYNVSNSVSLSTGTERNQTYVSLSNVDARGIIPNNNYSRYNISVRNSSKFLNDKLSLDLNMMYVKVNEQNMLAQGQYCNPLLPVYLFPRQDDIEKYKVFERYDPERNFKLQYWPFGNLGLAMQNPYWIIERNKFDNKKDRYIIGGSLKYQITPWFNLMARARVDMDQSVFEQKFSASTDGIFAGPQGSYYWNNYQTRQIYSDVLANFNKSFNKVSINATLGASVRDVQYFYSKLGGDLNSVPNLFSFNNLNFSTLQTLQEQYHDQTQALFGTAQIGYGGMFFLDLTGRSDWVSALAKTNTKAIVYPSIGLSGILTDIFNIHSKYLSFAKVRLSYSEVGNAPSRYVTIPTYPLENGFPRTTTFLPNLNLKPERTRSWETGFNVYFFDRKISLDLTMYKSSTFNQLFSPALSVSSGYGSVFVNAGRVDNKGIELSLGLNQDLGPVHWTSNLVYSLNRNKVVRLLPSYTAPNGENISLKEMIVAGTGSYQMKLTEGGSMGDIYVNTLKTDEHGYVAVDFLFQTVSADQNNFIYAGNANPSYTLGFRNSFEWKGLQFGFLVNARVGGVGVSMTQALMDGFGVSKATADARDAGGAMVNGQRIVAKNYYQVVGGGTSGVGSPYVYDATNVRLGEMYLGYELPVQKWIRWIKSVNVSVTGRNLFMFYNKAPFDPEQTSSTGTYYQGIDYFMQPSLRNVGFTCRLRF